MIWTSKFLCCTFIRMKAEIVKKNILTDELFIMWIRPGKQFTFEPGQYCTLGYEGTERPYSIVSAPHEKDLELFLEVAPKTLRSETSLTPKIFGLKVGAHLEMRPQAHGHFVLDKNFETHVMIATVTGIAPYMSMLRAYLHGDYKKQCKIYVFQGASYQDEFGYDQELKKMTEGGILTYVPTISRPQEVRNKGWQGATGRVNEIAQAQFKKYGITPKNTAVYLCGQHGMIDDLGNARQAPDKPLGKLFKAGFQIRREMFY